MSPNFSDFQSLHAATLHPFKWWKLSIKNGEIKQGFSLVGRDRLRKRVEDILGQAEALKEEHKIILEKVFRLSRHPRSWLYQVAPGKDVHLRSHHREGFFKTQPYEEKERYYNFKGEKVWRNFFRTMRLLFAGTGTKPTRLKNLKKQWHRVEWKPCARSWEPKITWLGHATLLIQAADLNILIDPAFHFVAPCFKRHTAPPIAFENMPLIDVVVLSHNHADHFDRSSLKKLAAYQPLAFVPHRQDGWFKKKGYQKVADKKWGQSTVFIQNGVEVEMTAIPAHHGSQTTPWDINRALWMGLMIEITTQEKSYLIYFAGDTGFNPQILSEIKNAFKPIDVACLPIAPTGQSEMHIDHRGALDVFEALGAKRLVPIHYGVYRTGSEKIEEPLTQFLLQVEQKGHTDKIHALRLGETLEVL